MFYSTVAGPANVYPGTAKFITDFQAKYGAAPQPFSAQAFDSMAICLKAIENAAKAKNNAVPTRAEVAQAIRAIKDFAGITGTINFNAKGDLTTAKYFVIKVLSGDPAKWGENAVEQTLEIAPPQ
jgi:branched-chain amino acid transport system substrate-binding protein